MSYPKSQSARPFLKWAGGKTQLLEEIKKALPANFRGQEYTFIEPFVGSGALLFWVLQNCGNVTKVVINDLNQDLINTYRVVAGDVESLIALLKVYQLEYHALEGNKAGKGEYYYAKREQYNLRANSAVVNAALFIFLNRTCFNGLYRVNRRNQFNVPIGSYKKPTICDEQNLRLVSTLLERVAIISGDFEHTLNYASASTLFYFDPPYKPLSATSSFNSYAQDDFDDAAQHRLRNFCSALDAKGHQWILSNSDVRGADPENHFFDELYRGFHIQRVRATRMINSKATQRGELNELLITNYPY